MSMGAALPPYTGSVGAGRINRAKRTHHAIASILHVKNGDHVRYFYLD